ANNFIEICQQLNRNGSICSLTCELNVNSNITNIRIVLTEQSYLPDNGLQNLSINSLTIKQQHLPIDFIDKISRTSSIQELNFNKIENLEDILSNKKINRLMNKIKQGLKIPKSSFKHNPLVIYVLTKIRKFSVIKSILEKLEIIQLKNETNLEEIYLNDNALNFVNLSINSLKILKNTTFINTESLEYLGIGFNLLNEKNKFYFTKSVENLDLSNNNFSKFSSKINLKYPINLQVLSLSHNKIEYLFVDLPSLTEIHLGWNQLKIIDSITGTKIYLYSNTIDLSELKLDKISTIDEIILTSNKIKSIAKNDLLTFENASSINLSNNQLKKIHFPHLKNLKKFIMSVPQISHLTNLVFVSLDNQNWNFISLPKNAFGNFAQNKTHLKISLKYNQFSSISPQHRSIPKVYTQTDS
ncbi:leucine Rich repeat-containing domain, partial [Brachionus plicatilis]